MPTSSPKISKLPVGRDLEAGDHAQRRGLAAARRAEQREELAVAIVEVDVVDGDDVAEPLGQCTHRYCGGHRANM